MLKLPINVHVDHFFSLPQQVFVVGRKLAEPVRRLKDFCLPLSISCLLILHRKLFQRFIDASACTTHCTAMSLQRHVNSCLYHWLIQNIVTQQRYVNFPKINVILHEYSLLDYWLLASSVILCVQS